MGQESSKEGPPMTVDTVLETIKKFSGGLKNDHFLQEYLKYGGAFGSLNIPSVDQMEFMVNYLEGLRQKMREADQMESASDSSVSTVVVPALQSEIEKLQNERKENKSENLELRVELENLREQLKFTNEQISMILENHDQKMEEFRLVREEMLAKNNELIVKNDCLIGENAKLLEKDSRMEEILKSKESEMKMLKCEFDRISANNSYLKVEADTARDELEQFKRAIENSDFSKLREDHKSTVDKLELELTHKKEQVLQLTSEVKHWEDTYHGVVEEIKADCEQLYQAKQMDLQKMESKIVKELKSMYEEKLQEKDEIIQGVLDVSETEITTDILNPLKSAFEAKMRQKDDYIEYLKSEQTRNPDKMQIECEMFLEKQYKKQIAEKDMEIEQLKKQISTKPTLLTPPESLLVEKNRRMADLKKCINLLHEEAIQIVDKDHENFEKEIKGYCTRIQELERALEEKAQVQQSGIQNPEAQNQNSPSDHDMIEILKTSLEVVIFDLDSTRAQMSQMEQRHQEQIEEMKTENLGNFDRLFGDVKLLKFRSSKYGRKLVEFEAWKLSEQAEKEREIPEKKQQLEIVKGESVIYDDSKQKMPQDEPILTPPQTARDEEKIDLLVEKTLSMTSQTSISTSTETPIMVQNVENPEEPPKSPTSSESSWSTLNSEDLEEAENPQ